MNIVIPTYERHLDYNINFLKSFDKFCLDKTDVRINFICSNSNYELFCGLKTQFNNLNVNIITLSQLIKKVNGIDFDDNVNNFLVKYSYQSIKKLFAFSIVDDDYLVFDSENLCLKEFYFLDTFNAIKRKSISYTPIYRQQIQIDVVNNSNFLLNNNDPNWYFLNSYWFFEREHIAHLINDLERTHNNKSIYLLKDILFFEYQLYANFLVKHDLKSTVSVDDLLKNYQQLKNNLDKSEHNYEYICATITDDTIDLYIDFLNSQDERITRLHWMPEHFAKKIIDNTSVSIGTFHWD